MKTLRPLLACCLWLGLAGHSAAALAEEKPARLLFGREPRAAELPPAPVGSYAKGCLAGGVELPHVGVGYQTMRPKRNRAWGHPTLLLFLEDLAANLASEGYAPLLIGDLSQPRGGPMLTGHRSHQIGLDADIWFRPSPPYQLTLKQREEWSAESVVKGRSSPWVNEKFTYREVRMLEVAARDRRVARIFVGAPIKKALCEMMPAGERDWLRKIRPWYGHIYHFHVRLSCPPGTEGACVDQKPPPAGDGCGKELTSWLTPPKPPKNVAKKPKPKAKPKKRREIMLSQLPSYCIQVLDARDRR